MILVLNGVFLLFIFRTNMKLIDERETDFEDENLSIIHNVHDYQSAFKPNRTRNFF